MVLHLQRADRDPPEPEERLAATQAIQPLTLAGFLVPSRSTLSHVLQLITGLALLRGILRCLLRLFGYSCPITLKLNPTTVELNGEKKLLGITLRRFQHLIPLTAVQRMTLERGSTFWAIAALILLIMASACCTLLLYWGVIGLEPVWMLTGIALLILGIFADALAYLWTRRGSARKHGTLEIWGVKKRFRINQVLLKNAEELVSRLRESGLSIWNHKK